MELNLQTKQQLATLLAKPSLVTQAHSAMLTDLVRTYPYYQPLHLLLARANHNTSQNDHLATAALYNNGGLLHQVVYQPETLNYIDVKLINAIKADDYLEQQSNQEPEEEVFKEEIIPVITAEDEDETFEEIAEIAVPTATPSEALSVNYADDQETHEEITEFIPVSTIEEKPEVETEPHKEAVGTGNSEDSDEVFEEIAEVNEVDFTSPPAPEQIEGTPLSKESRQKDDLNDLELESIVSTDFFAFEKKMDVEAITEPQKFVHPEEYNLDAEAQTVSKYYDDKLPYTFLWWLSKTRKEHEQIFQPYVSPKKQANTNPLQQQYIEHIFHLQTPFNVTEEVARGPVNNNVVHKGADIIDSFIKNEPQIRAPKAELINNENKGKKSAEDNYDLVSETLAAIYIEQMLYHKAIDTYEKLSLKFPEKSRYFADLIQSLEKKI